MYIEKYTLKKYIEKSILKKQKYGIGHISQTMKF